MDNEYFGFTESPFNVTSDPRFYFNRYLSGEFHWLALGDQAPSGF